MSRREQPIASSSSTTLESELSYPTPSSLSTTTDTTSEAIPTLSSLLLSTAESLVSRSKTLPTSSGFTLSSSPSTLLSNPSTTPYLSSLLSQSLPSLSALPKSLASLSSTLDSDLSTLAFTRYPSFLLSHEASQQISTSFTSLSESLTSLLDSTSELDIASHSFEGKVNEIRKKRDRIRLVRERIEAVEELLEAPTVVESCVRAGQWNEAIQVSRRISQSLKRYQARDQSGGALGILERVQDGVDRALLGLRGKVLETLGERTLKLPGAVRGVGILRKISTERLEVESGKGKRKEGGLGRELNEDGLRIVFLSARWKCLKGELDAVEAQMSACGIDTNGGGATVKGKVSVEENDERTRWIKRWIEVWREIVGETIGMYSEVFLSSSSGETDKEQEIELDEFLVPRPTLPPTAPLELFLSTSLTSLHSILRSSLSYLTSTASLSTLLTQLTYCSHSFTRHGLSFHSHLQLSQLFENRVSQIMLTEWEQAGKKWEAEWREGWSLSGGSALITTTIKARRNGRTPIKDWLVVPEGVNTLLSTPLPPAPTSFTSANIDSPHWHHQPSATLALLPPLAHLLNTYVNSLNSLRLLPPSSIFPTLLIAQSKELERASRVLEAFIDAWSSSFAQSTPIPPKSFDANDAEMSEEESIVVREREEEKRVVMHSIAWFGRELIPWVRGALVEGVYRELHQQKEKGGKKAEETGLREARKRVEKLIARIEGREWVDPDAPRPVEAEVRINGNTNRNEEIGEEREEESIEEDGGALPVLEIPAGPLESISSPATTANGTGEHLEREEPLEFTASPIEPSPTDEPSLDLPSNGGGEFNEGDDVEEEEEGSKPYLVDEIAPPPPLPAQENGTNGIEKEEEQSLGQEEAVEPGVSV